MTKNLNRHSLFDGPIIQGVFMAGLVAAATMALIGGHYADKNRQEREVHEQQRIEDERQRHYYGKAVIYSPQKYFKNRS